MHKFFDTNIFGYSIDLRDKKKQNTARELIRKFPRSEITISTQVLQEFYNIATTKLKHDVATSAYARSFKQCRYKITQKD